MGDRARDQPGTPGGDDELARMFDRFWRKDKSRSREAGGSGLGLSIAATLVTSRDGHVTSSQTPAAALP